MTAYNPFEENQLEKTIGQGKKENPITKKTVPQKQEYKSVRVYPETYEIFRVLAFENRKKVVEMIEEAAALLQAKYKGD